MSEFTPGPWEQYGGTCIISPTDCEMVCELSNPKPESGFVSHERVLMSDRQAWDKAMANARLIAAAPDLLAACDGAIVAIGAVNEDAIGTIQLQALERLHKAIAKAKGNKDG